jgi:hypothetical protein
MPHRIQVETQRHSQLTHYLNKAGIHFGTWSRLSNLNSTDSGSLPLGDFAPLGLLHPDNLVTVEKAERVEGSFELV